MPPITAASSSTAQPAGDQKRVALPQHTIEFGERVHGFGRRELRYRAAAGREDAAPEPRGAFRHLLSDPTIADDPDRAPQHFAMPPALERGEPGA